MDVRLLPPPGNVRQRLKTFLDERLAQLSEDDFLTVMIPEVLERGSLVEILRRPGLHRLKGWLLNERRVQVMDVPIVKEDIDPDADQAQESARNYVIVLVSGGGSALTPAPVMGSTSTMRTTR